MVIVMMGVSGSGKSTLGMALADAEGWEFKEGDLLHPRSNREKMRAGIALDDADRAPWLDRVAAWVADQLAQGRNGVVACSALKHEYRDRLRSAGDDVRFVCLQVPRSTLEKRMRQRHHFMPPSLLDSQLDTLQPPVDEPDTLIVSGDESVDVTVAKICSWANAPR